MKTLSRDARVFVDEVVKYVGRDRKGRIVAPRVQTLLTRVTTAAQKERIANVVTVVAMNENEKASVKRMLSKILGHDVECRFSTDAQILGGMKIQVADWVVDTSLLSQLNTLTQTLL